jgi:hypothetical protein
MVMIAAVIVGACLVSVTSAQQVANRIDYDTFCKLPDQDAKRSAFRATTAENRGEIVRTHLQRWRDANRTRLNDKQMAYLAAMIESITSETYSDGPKGEEARVKSRAIIEANVGLFGQQDMQAMQPYAPCIDKAK